MNVATADTTPTQAAPFTLRLGALLIDYAVCAATLAGATVAARWLASETRGAARGDDVVEGFGYLLTLSIFAFNFIVLAGFTGRTFGKWATGICIADTRGHYANFARVFLRHVIGYPLTILTFGLGFLLAAFGSRKRALHDYLAGTIVLRDTSVTRDARREKVKTGTATRTRAANVKAAQAVKTPVGRSTERSVRR